MKNSWDTPWRYIGPVLESDRVAVAEAKKADGNAPQWSADTVYVAGDTVQRFKHVYRAKWWNQGAEPRESPDRPYDDPWDFIGLTKDE